jgi:hypothetical protein
MIQETQHQAQTPWQDREVREPCTGCSASMISDPVDGGLNCARCGQWQALCGDCMPTVAEHSRDAAWVCPECHQ